MSIRLNVPLVAQLLSMECWYASACMVAYYFAPGPRLGLPKQWASNKGIDPTLGDFAALARNEKLVPIAAPNRLWSNVALEKVLRDFGPVWCAGYWYGVPHIVVLTGVDDTKVYINDPDGAKAKQGSIAWFNQKLAKTFSGCMLRRAT